MWLPLLTILRCPVCGPPGTLRLLAEPRVEAEDGEILAGVLTCGSCYRWFRVEDGVPDLVRDGLREVEEERRFLAAHAAALPEAILREGIPFAAEGPVPEQTAEDLRIVREGRHWGRFMRRFWDVGDRSIFDIRVKGTHPPFYVKGVLETDDRDCERPWGIFPRATGNLLFSRLSSFRGKRGVDVGCGGGQFGLEAARQGVQMVGFDPSFEELVLARRHAREHSVLNIEYVRAEPAHPPFAPATFDLMMAKDALHHVPDLERVFDGLMQLLTKEAVIVCHEHISRAPHKERFMDRVRDRLLRRIWKRYPRVEVPAELLTDSANEGAGASAVAPCLERHFHRLVQVDDLFLADDFEMLVYFASGKRRWPARAAHLAGRVLERIFLLMGDRQHLSFVGRRRAPRA